MAKVSKALEARMQELQELTATLAPTKPWNTPREIAKNADDITHDVPDVAILIVGNDDRVMSAMANKLRMFIEEDMECPTVPLGNFRTSENFVDYDEVRRQYPDVDKTNQDLFIADEVETIWDGMLNSYPSIRKGQMKVGVEIWNANVSISEEVVQTASIKLQTSDNKEQVLLDQKMTTFR